MKTGQLKSSHLRLKTFLALVITSMCFASASQGAQSQDPQPPPKIVRKSGGLLQGSVTRRVEPVYPPLAKAAQVSGAVVVEVTLDEEGNVISARAISGHPLLKDAAVAAAREWKFSETKLRGEPVKVVGTITFNFMLDNSKEIEALKAEVAANPESAEAHFKLGVAYLNFNNGAQPPAVDSLKRAIQIKPDYADAYTKLGEAYCKAHTAQGQGDHTKEEVDAFEQAIRINPGSAEAYFGLANAHTYHRPLKTEENLLAAGLLKYAVKLRPDYHEAYRALSDVYQYLDRNDEAIDVLKEYAQSHPRQGNVLLAKFSMRVSRYEDAVEPLKQILKDDPANFYTHFELGSVYAALGNRELAMQEYEALKPINNDLAERLLKVIDK
ncbi:MAG TPA: TonB family protein [Blastocatellia bacterium]|nr:TonB family protein [Blastocatellia bacterium]